MADVDTPTCCATSAIVGSVVFANLRETSALRNKRGGDSFDDRFGRPRDFMVYLSPNCFATTAAPSSLHESLPSTKSHAEPCYSSVHKLNAR